MPCEDNYPPARSGQTAANASGGDGLDLGGDLLRGRVRGGGLEGEQLGHVALHLDLPAQERLHGGLLVLVDEQLASRLEVGGDRDLRVVEGALLDQEVTGRGVDVGAHLTVAERR